MNDTRIFTIQEMDLLPDCFRSAMASRAFTPVDGVITGWPSFHVSQADPDGGYQPYTYSVSFTLAQPEDLTLHLGVIVSTPRLPDIRLTVNGREGMFYAWPMPSKDKEIKPGHALHAAIYSRDDLMIAIPAAFTQAGENTLAITAVDALPELQVFNHEAVLRLDRMADACGWHYGALELMRGAKLASGASLRPSVVYVKGTDGTLQERVNCVLTTLPGEKEVRGEVRLAWQGGEMAVPYDFAPNDFGQYRLSLLLPDGTGEVRYSVTGTVQAEGSFTRRRKWNVFITPHAHTDIGYTHRQWEVLERMSRNLDEALALLGKEAGDHFSYILDSSIALEDYLATRAPEKREAVLSLCKAGKLGIPSNYVDLLSWFASLEDLIHNGDFTDGLLRQAGMQADRVDMVDVASATSAYPTLLAGMGVKYFMHANNQDRGPFRFNGNLHRHSPFWWQGKDGARILVWLSRMYCELKKVCGSPGSIPAAERGLEMWLQDYERDTYAPDAVVLYGMEADNTDIDVRMADFVAAWNGQCEYPRLVPSDGSSFFDYVQKWADTFPVYTGDEGAYWEDGAASSLNESIEVRRAQAGLKCAETMDSLGAMVTGGQFPVAQYDEAWRQVLLYDEHTWGAFLSQADAEAMLQRDSWAVKKHMADSAARMCQQLTDRSSARLMLLWNNAGREVVLMNPYSFPVTDMVEVEFAAGETVCGQDGRELPWLRTVRTRTQQTARFLVEDLPGMTIRRYPLRPAQPGDHAGSYAEQEAAPRQTLENDAYCVCVDTERGVITSLVDKRLGRELAGKELGQLLYAMGGEGSTLRGNHAGLRRDGASVSAGFLPDTRRVRTSLVDQRVILSGQAFRGHAQVSFILPNGQKELEMEYVYDKAATTDPEAVYVALDFALPEDTQVLSDSQVGWVDWQDDVLPGVCREWLPLQTSILLKTPGCQVQVASPDAFLFTVGEPVMGKWVSELNVRGGKVYSYVLNNYWHTNYLGEQGGRFTFRYAITSAQSIAPETAYRFGWTHRQGAVAKRMSYQEFRKDVPEVVDHAEGGTLMTAPSDHIFVNTLRGARYEKGAWLVRLNECGGRAGEVALSFPGKTITRVQPVDHLEHPLAGEPVDPAHVALTPWQVRSLLLWVE